MEPLFKAVPNCELPVPVLRTNPDGSPRVEDGVTFLSAEQAARMSTQTEAQLIAHWNSAMRDFVADVDEGEVVVDVTTGEEKVLRFEDLSDAEILQRARERQRGDYSVDEWAQFVTMAAAMGYNIDARECYPKRAANPETGAPTIVLCAKIEALERRVLASGLYNGMSAPLYCGPDGAWTDTWTSTTPATMCRIEMYRKGIEKPQPITVSLSEFVDFDERSGLIVNGDRFWRIKFLFMLCKCARARGFRELFRDVVGNVYLTEEIPDVRRPPAAPLSATGPRPVEYAIDADVAIDETCHTEGACRRALAAMHVSSAGQDRLIAEHRALFRDQEDMDPDAFYGAIVANAQRVAYGRRRSR